MSTQVCVVGIVATEPKHVITSTGVPLCSFRLASSERRYDRDSESWVEGETNWFSVSAFRSLAENAGTSFSKGERVIVAGKLRVRQWEREGKQGTAVDIDAEAVGHDLRFGTSAFTKNIFSAGVQNGVEATDRLRVAEDGHATDETRASQGEKESLTPNDEKQRGDLVTTYPGGHWGTDPNAEPPY